MRVKVSAYLSFWSGWKEVIVRYMTTILADRMYHVTEKSTTLLFCSILVRLTGNLQNSDQIISYMLSDSILIF